MVIVVKPSLFSRDRDGSNAHRLYEADCSGLCEVPLEVISLAPSGDELSELLLQRISTET
jgi:hypothetical protein